MAVLTFVGTYKCKHNTNLFGFLFTLNRLFDMTIGFLFF